MSLRLLLVELRRLRWRRAVLALVLLAVAIPAVIGASRAWSTRPVTEDDRARVVQEQAGEIERCVEHPRQMGLTKGATEQQCEDQIISWYVGREKLSLVEERNGGPGMALVAVLMAVLLLAGTTFAGHDWNSGSMSNQLLFEPRRLRVWSAKALAVTLLAAVVATVVSTAYWVSMWALMRGRDLPMRDGALVDSLAFGLRGAGFAAAAALGGYALTMLLRSTVATLGVLFAVSVAGGIVVAVLGLGDQWQPQKNISAIVKNGVGYYVDVPQSCFTARAADASEPDATCDSERTLSLAHGVGYYGSALVVAVGASLVSFRRRDVP